ncbi:nitrate reductase [Hordeum vulgare]|nr:nitrate reductase [Hordeum vulgare]
MPLTPVKREREEVLPLRVVKREPERRGVIGMEDYLPPTEVDAIEAVILARRAWEEDEEQERHRQDVEINQIFLEQGLYVAQKFAANQEEWRLVAKQWDEVYVDLVSSSDDD